LYNDSPSRLAIYHQGGRDTIPDRGWRLALTGKEAEMALLDGDALRAAAGFSGRPK
jgi:hypothetical protein